LDKPLFRNPEEHPALWAEDALSLPSALFKRWVRRHGHDGATALALQALSEPALSLVCTGGNRNEMARALDEAGVPSRPGRHEHILLVERGSTGAVLASEAFASGALTVQGETALRAAELLGAKPGERLLELGAAPGGKSAALALKGARVLAVDKNPRRLAAMPAALVRMGVSDRVQPLASDGLTGLAPEAALFDGALVDAPCSNTGVLAARPGARWRFGPGSLAQLVTLQGELLDQAARWVAPKGRLVFSTCSLEPEEGSQGARAFLSRHPRWSLVEEHLDLPSAAVEGPLDGGYRALLRREG
jgi:16S rRNA (cytosine967-C5)-methyltransferase